MPGKFLSLRIFEDQFTCTSPLSLDNRQLKHCRGLCKQSVMYDHVKSVNSVAATVHEVSTGGQHWITVKNGLLTLSRYYKPLSKPFFTITSRTVAATEFTDFT